MVKTGPFRVVSTHAKPAFQACQSSFADSPESQQIHVCVPGSCSEHYYSCACRSKPPAFQTPASTPFVPRHLCDLTVRKCFSLPRSWCSLHASSPITLCIPFLEMAVHCACSLSSAGLEVRKSDPCVWKAELFKKETSDNNSSVKPWALKQPSFQFCLERTVLPWRDGEITTPPSGFFCF